MDLKQKFDVLVRKLNLGQLEEVIFETNFLIKKYPKQDALYNLLSIAYQSKGDYEKSILLLNDALKKSKNNINFLNNLGLTYYKKKDYISAENFFLKTLEISPNYINTINNLASLYHEINQYKKSEDLYIKALSINPDVLETNYNYASFLQSIGKFDDAKNYYEKTLTINENFTRADRGLAMLKKYQKNDEHITLMEDKLKKNNLHDLNIKDLSFALSKAYEDLGDYEKSFYYINKANKLKKKITKFDINNEKKLFEKIKTFHQNIKVDIISHKENEKKIIFILGMPRTGTSLVEQIISNHTDVYGGGEIVLLDTFFKKFFNQENNEEKLYKIFDNYKNNYLNVLNKMTDLKIVTDKAPLNFRWIGLIKIIFPNSIIIHCSRDPFENSWSIYKNEFEGGMLFSNDIKDIAEYYKIYENLMTFWKKIFNDHIYDLKYEELINDPDKKIKELINFCGLKWQESCLEFYKNKKIIKTVSFSQARKPIYKDSIEGSKKFKQYLHNLDVALKN